MNPLKPFKRLVERFPSIPFPNPSELVSKAFDRCKNKFLLHQDFRISFIVGMALVFSAFMLNAQANSAYYGALNDRAMFLKAQGVLEKAEMVAEQNAVLYKALQEGTNEDVPDDLAQRYAGSVLRLTNPVLANALGFEETDKAEEPADEIGPLFDQLDDAKAGVPKDDLPSESLGQQIKKALTSKLENHASLIEDTASFKLNFISFANPIKLPSISSRFGIRHGRSHAGTDFQAPIGTSIFAAAGGRVITASMSGAYGNLVVIDHGNGIHTRYAHCSSLLVNLGQTVKRGQLIAKVGSTGRSTGPHLHFEMVANSSHMNPEQYLPSSSRHKTRTVVMRRGFRKVSEL